MTKTPKKTATDPAPAPALANSAPVALATAQLEAISTSDVSTLTAEQVAELAASDAARLEAEQAEAHHQAELAMQGEVDRMQAMAQRIWDGQSVSLPNKVRKERIVAALADQGFEHLFGYLRAPEGYESTL